MLSPTPLCWNPAVTPAELHDLLSTLGADYPIATTAVPGAVAVHFEKTERPGISEVTRRGDDATVCYSSVTAAARGIGTLLAGLSGAEATKFTTLGIMLDCSRNAVMKVEEVRHWLRELALLGYGRAMLYTEDTYELPGEPYFGYMRGAYTEAELRELDAYAAKLGIELIGCIQTLGHLDQILRWPAYQPVRDTGGVLLVDAEATYALIEKMIACCARSFTSRTLHIGMDETHDLGRGRRLDLHGYERGFELFNRHLERVCALCRKYGLKPMIWSDMYFRMGNQNLDYYDPATVIPPEVSAAIPADVDLVYWDYYHFDQAFYADWIKRHRDLGKEPLLGSGIWSWARLWYDHPMTRKTVRPALLAAREAGLEHFFFTMWGDDGAFCEYDSVMAGLTYAAELCWGNDPDQRPEAAEARLAAICGEDYQSCLAFADLQYPEGNGSAQDSAKVFGHALLWDDPLLGICFTDACRQAPGWLKNALTLYHRLAAWPLTGATPAVRHGKMIAKTLAAKLRFRHQLEQAYFLGDRRALAALGELEVPKLAEQYRQLLHSFRSQWMKRNKPFGWEVIAMRTHAQIGRLEETALRIKEYLDGETPDIAELEESRKITETTPTCGVYAIRGSLSGSCWL